MGLVWFESAIDRPVPDSHDRRGARYLGRVAHLSGRHAKANVVSTALE